MPHPVMNSRCDKAIVVLGSIGAGSIDHAWESVHYLIGLRRLGYQPWYVESPLGDEPKNSAPARMIDRVLTRFGFGDRWAYQPQDAAICLGISTIELSRLYREAELIIHLPASAPPTPKQCLTNRLIFVRNGSAPGTEQEQRVIFTRPPVVLDLWRPFGTNPTNQKNKPKWHLSQPTELARDLLASLAYKGIQPTAPDASTCDDHRDSICNSRGELSFGNASPISHRTACYLAAGRPVIRWNAKDDLPSGPGSLTVNSINHAIASVALIESDYNTHSQSAARLASDYFDATKVLGDLLDKAGLPTRNPHRKSTQGNPENHNQPDFASSMRVNGIPGYHLIISGLGDGDTGGGLFAIDGRTCQPIDRLSTTGLTCADGNLHRLLWSDQSSSGELLTYDRGGVARYCRVDSMIDPHDLLWDGTHFVIVSSGTNSILWVAPDGQIVRRWEAPGNRDAWHLNCLQMLGNRLCVSAFGRFAGHRGWSGKLRTEKPGILFDLVTGEDVLTGLSAPHTPRMLDGSVILCNSAESELLLANLTTRQINRRLKLTGWTRGLAFTDDVIFVGESANRLDTSMGLPSAQITVLCRRTWQILHRFPVPCREVYDLVMVPADLVDGLKLGFRNNPLRMAEQNQYDLFRAAGVEPKKLWAISERLPKQSLRISLAASPPSTRRPSQRFAAKAVLRNDSDSIFVAAPPMPVRAVYRWISPSTGDRLPTGEPPHGDLPRSLPPGESTEVTFDVIAPREPGSYILRLTLVQETVFWFDDVDPRNACDLPVDVVR